jgi:hypothetical protein
MLMARPKAANSHDLYQALKKLIPDLPDTCIDLQLNLGADSMPVIMLVEYVDLEESLDTKTTTFNITPREMD